MLRHHEGVEVQNWKEESRFGNGRFRTSTTQRLVAISSGNARSRRTIRRYRAKQIQHALCLPRSAHTQSCVVGRLELGVSQRRWGIVDRSEDWARTTFKETDMGDAA